MEEELVLDVRGLSKSFLINKDKHQGFKEAIADLFTGRLKKGDTFWALQDISFTLNRGDVLGIIGKNGAGKSTLLRILSCITQPDTGEVNFYGKLASVLDVGAGFHPELTGRENIFLAAQLFGLSKQEVERAYNSIVEFSGIAQFIDEPVKNYSTGMYVRLAFSVVTSVNADILVFDEILGAGDVGFQEKIKQYLMEKISAHQAIVVVSHNMDLLGRICNRFIQLENGKAKAIGGHEVITGYIFNEERKVKQRPDVVCLHNVINREAHNVLLEELEVKALSGNKETFYIDDSIEFALTFTVKGNETVKLDWIFSVSAVNGVGAFSDSPLYRKEPLQGREFMPGVRYRVTCRIPAFFFNYGYFYLNVFCVDGIRAVFEELKVLLFEMRQPVWEVGRVYGSKAFSLLRPALDWNIAEIK